MESDTQDNLLLAQSYWCWHVSVMTKVRDQVETADLCFERKFQCSIILIKHTHTHKQIYKHTHTQTNKNNNRVWVTMETL